MSQFSDLVKSELEELESKDVDQLFECIRDNCLEMGMKMTDQMDGELYREIERQLKRLPKPKKYQLVITFESKTPIKGHSKADQGLLQYENGLGYFVKGDVNNSFVYGTGTAKLSKVKAKAKRKTRKK
jgi:hypothetical protein